MAKEGESRQYQELGLGTFAADRQTVVCDGMPSLLLLTDCTFASRISPAVKLALVQLLAILLRSILSLAQENGTPALEKGSLLPCVPEEWPEDRKNVTLVKFFARDTKVQVLLLIVVTVIVGDRHVSDQQRIPLSVCACCACRPFCPGNRETHTQQTQ